MSVRKSYTPNFAVFEDRNDIPMNGVARLTASILISGSTVYPTFRYIGGMATATGWKPDGYGGADGNLTVKGATNPISASQGSPCLGPDDDSVLFNLGQYYQAPNGTFGEFGTDDIIMEVVFKMSGNDVSRTIIDKRATVDGWMLQTTVTNGLLNMYLDDGPTIVSVGTAPLTEDVWYHAMFFMDRSGYAAFYVNGVLSGNQLDVSALNSLSFGVPLRVGARDGGATPYNKNIAYLAMWQKASWLGTHLQVNLALDRFNQLTGIYPQIAKGSARPTTQTRATTAYIDKVEKNGIKKLYNVSSGWLRCCSRLDTNGTRVRGYLAEPAATNVFTYSNDFSNAAWTSNGTKPTVTADDTTAPDGTTTADKVEGIGTFGGNDLNNTGTGIADGVSLAPGFWIKRISISGTLRVLYPWDPANGNWTINMADLPDRWVRIDRASTYPTFTVEFSTRVGGEVGMTLAASSGTIDAHLWGGQMEAGYTMATSTIPTVAAAVTRVGDVLTYKGDDGNVANNQQGQMSCDVLMPNYAPPGSLHYVSLNDGGSTSYRINTYTNGLYIANVGEQAATGAEFDSTDGVKHTLGPRWKLNDASFWADGIQYGATDVECTIPDDLDQIQVGAAQGGWQQMGGLIANVKIWDKPNNTKG